MKNQNSLIDNCIEIRDFFSQLFQDSGITYFEHTRVYADGRTIYLNTLPNYLEHFYHKQYSRPACDVYKEGGLFLWAGIPELYRYDNQMLDMRLNFNIDHGACFIEVSEGHIDICDFATCRDGEQLINYYIKEQKKLAAIVEEYHSKFGSLYLKHINQANTIPLRPNKSKHNEIHHPNSIKSLTDREMDCLLLITKGLTAKRIAILLGISYRTVEQHIGNIKRKSRVKTIAELLKVINSV